jgi:methylated-DNA-[protein]-cysteine S-methyltransferase
MLYFDGITTPLGRLHIVVSDEAIVRIYFPGEKWTERYERTPRHELIVLAKTQLAEYFAGERRKFDLPLLPQGSEFQIKVWKTIAKIPYGKTITYADEAKKMRKPDAVRAVGTANGKNPIPIIIPCHRIIPNGGGLGGYSGGVSRKKLLLKLEQHYLGIKK